MHIAVPTVIQIRKRVKKYMVFPVVTPALLPCVPTEPVAGITITLLRVQPGTVVVHHRVALTATIAAQGAAVQPTLEAQIAAAAAAEAVAEAAVEAHLLDHSPAVAVNNIWKWLADV